MESTVKVGVRIRPLLSKERHQNNSLTNYDSQSIEFKNQTFTYDYVFGMDLPQQELYQNTAAPMLKSFLDGFNVTIIAYGQTGSGKTYTMGTADNDSQDPNSEGLIPRFVCDLFDNLENFARNETLESNVKVSFLEIYGEDVYDLLSESRSADRLSLPVRESDNGLVFVQNLQELIVTSSGEALNALTSGSKNRITAATNMNAGSSRSHAVFTITLVQKVKSSNNDEDISTNITSKLTFVDLAGSERIKRTGAEGQRMKEGIQINSGLFNLGQVINGLADDHRLKQGAKPVHIPYRNSKLTHLLKDALGGNSQTLFLACVSPAESNESETYSTLSYARQARNIKNKPVRNMDKQQLELRRLRYQMKAWMTKAVLQMVQSGNQLNPQEIDDLMSNIAHDGLDVNSDILQRSDVQQYIATVNEKIDTIVLGGSQPSPRKYRMSIVSPRIRRSIGTSRPYGMIQKKLQFNEDTNGLSGITEDEKFEEFQSPEDAEELVTRMIELINKEKENKENNSSSDDDDENTSTSNTNANTSTEPSHEEMDEVDREITEKEEILLKLKEAVKGFSTMKQEYENLLSSIHILELERNELELALEKATKSQQQQQQAEKPLNSQNMEKLQERYIRVKEELEKMKTDRNKKESTYRLIQSETKRCEILNKEIIKLKEIKVKLQQTQRQQQQQYQKYKKEQNLKMGILKKSDVKRQKQMNELKCELQKKVRVLGNKDREILRINSKLKAAEDHINQLIRLNNTRRQKLITTGTSKGNDEIVSLITTSSTSCGSGVTSGANNTGGISGGATTSGGDTSSYKENQQYLQTTKNILENLIQDKIDFKYNKKILNKKLINLKEMKEEMNEMILTIKELEKKKENLERKENKEWKQNKEEDTTSNNNDHEEGEEDHPPEGTSMDNDEMIEINSQLKSYEMNLHKLSSEINILNEDIADLSRQIGDTSSKDISESSWENISRGVITSLTTIQSQSLLWDYLQNKADLIDNLRDIKDKNEELQELYENSQEKMKILQHEIEFLQNEMKHVSTTAEKQRINDIWILLKTQNNNLKEIDNNNSSIQSIAIQRAQELEDALSESLAIENELKSEIYELKYQNKELLQKLQEKIMLEQIFKKKRSSRRDDNEDTVYDHGHDHGDGNGDGNDDDVEEETNQHYKKVKEEISNQYSELDSLWVKLGTSVIERGTILDTIDNASQLALQKALNEARQQYSCYHDEEVNLQRKFNHLTRLLSSGSGTTSTSSSNATPTSSETDNQDPTHMKDTLIIRIEQLKQKLNPIIKEFELRCEKLKNIIHRFQKVIEEMEYDVTTLPIEIQILLKMDLQYLSIISIYTIDQRISYCLLHKIPFTLSIISFIESKLLELSLECTNNISRITELIQSITPLRHRLDYKSIEDFTQLLNNSEDTSTTSATSASTGTSIQEVGIELILNHKIKVTGSGKILEFLENILYALISLKTNRETCIKNLIQFTTSFSQYFNLNLVHTSSLQSNDQGDAIDVITRSYITDYLQQMNQFPSLLDSYLDSSQLGLYALANDLGISSEEYEPRMNVIANTPPQTTDELQIYSDITNPMKVLEGIVPFIDEMWLKVEIEEFLRIWNERSNDANFAIILLTEKNRMAKYSELLQEMRRQDAHLVQHITDMEAFEISSKQNRQKVLMGNSKALVDEEKFRKSGKKKFEMISEKLLEAARSAQSCSGGFPMDISKLSSSGQDLLRGKVHERTELMHLHTMTHGAKRWSGESENHDEQNNENHILLNHVEPQCTGPTPTPGKKLANKKVSTKKETTTRSFHPPR